MRKDIVLIMLIFAYFMSLFVIHNTYLIWLYDLAFLVNILCFFFVIIRKDEDPLEQLEEQRYI